MALSLFSKAMRVSKVTTTMTADTIPVRATILSASSMFFYVLVLNIITQTSLTHLVVTEARHNLIAQKNNSKIT